MEREITVTVDGREVAMNNFVRSMVINVLAAIIDSLKGADPSGKVEIRMEPAGEAERDER
jgi:hypothetical protein